jgi:tRNA-dihydrouridine synthase A
MTASAHPGWRFSVAPMMDWTDRHCRAFHRTLSARALLCTEMVTANAVIHGERERLIGWSPADEGAVALQLGGNEPEKLAESARIAADFGYHEINLNCGCPSGRVQDGAFGACLMREPALVAACVAAMKAAVRVPVTVKCRIGVDDQEPADALFALAAAVRHAGADALIVHARKAWLQGLSPKQNRDVPPLDYPLVHALKVAHPDWPIAINGGLKGPASWAPHLAALDGVMLGREAYQNPEALLAVDPEVFGQPAPHAEIFAALDAFAPYMERQLAQGYRLHAITRHMVGLFPGRRGSRLFRQALSAIAANREAGVAEFQAAVALVKDRIGEAQEAA